MTPRLCVAAAVVLAAPAAWGGMFNDLAFIASVPTLDEIGLGAIIALVAGVAGWAIRKRGGRGRR